MELDEAIKHCRDKAEELNKDADYLDAPYGMDTSARTECLECAKEHEQLADWLEELKVRREQDQTKWIPCDDRLPEDDRMVLVSICGSDIIMINEGESLEDALERNWKTHRRVSTGYYVRDEDDEGWYNDGFPMIVRPVAWMPIPVYEPYNPDKEVDNETNN